MMPPTEKASVLTGDATVRSIQTQVRGLLNASVEGGGGMYSRLSDIGVTLQKDGTLAVDNSKLQKAIDSNFSDITNVLGAVGKTSDTLLGSLLGSTGPLNARTDGINASLKSLASQKERISDRLVDVERRYRAQFTALDVAIASMNQHQLFPDPTTRKSAHDRIRGHIMFGTLSNGANAYARVGVETGVVAASPHKLIVMLFDGALVAVSNAAAQMKAGDIAGKGKSISKVISIIDNGLRASLDKKAGGGIAANLDALYEYMSNRLLQANLANQPEILDEVHGLLKDLKESWEAIGDAPAPVAAAPAPAQLRQPKASPYDSLTPHSARLVKA